MTPMNARSFLYLYFVMHLLVVTTPGTGQFYTNLRGASCACAAACLCHQGGACGLPDEAEMAHDSHDGGDDHASAPELFARIPEGLPVISARGCGCMGGGTALSDSNLSFEAPLAGRPSSPRSVPAWALGPLHGPLAVPTAPDSPPPEVSLV